MCSEVDAAYWCEDCKQWLGRICKKSHGKMPIWNAHTLVSLTTKREQVKIEFAKEATEIKETMDEYSRSIRNIQDQVGKLEITQAEALEKSDKLRHKIIKEINEVFDAIDAKVIAFMQEQIKTLEDKQKLLEKDLKDIEIQWKQLDELVKENSSKLAIEGSVFIEKAKQLKEAKREISIQKEQIVISVSPGSKWNPESAAQVQLCGGNIAASNDSYMVDLSGLCNKTLSQKTKNWLKKSTNSCTIYQQPTMGLSV